MSFNNVRNEKGISKKRAIFSNGDKLNIKEINSFENGVSLGGGALIVNMDSNGTSLESVKNAKTLASIGGVDAECFDAGKYVFKQGATLYIYDIASGESFAAHENMPEDEECVIYHLYGCFAAFCDGGSVYLVSDSAPYETGVTSLYKPIIYKINVNEQEKMESLNFLTEYCRIQVSVSSGNTCELPKEFLLDPDFWEVETTAGMALSKEAIGFNAHEDGGATIVGRSINTNFYITVRLKRDENGAFTDYDKIEKSKGLFFSPLGSVAFASSEEGKKNLICYGGEYEAEFAAFSLDKTAYVPEKDMLIYKNTEKITSILRYSEEYLIFSPHYIRKMVLAEDEKTAKRFSVSVENFKYDVGCDMPGSAVCADDKIIYANSKAGVFYIDRFGFSQRDMSRNVSANIENGENGLFAMGEAALEGAKAVICGGKYYLCLADVFYVWDFLYGVPSSGTEKISESRKMRWTLASGLSCERILGSDVKEFYFITDQGELASLSVGTSFGASEAESVYKSENVQLSLMGKVCVFKLSLAIACAENVCVKCFFDGEESSAKYTLQASGEHGDVYEILPEKRYCRNFAFSVSSFGALRIDGARIEWY